MKILLFFIVPLVFCFVNAFLILGRDEASGPGKNDAFSRFISGQYESGRYGPLSGFCIQRKGQIMYQKAPLFIAPQPVESITKSVAALVIGIAIQRGDLKNLDQHIVDFFPEYTTGMQKGWEGVTIGDLLTMRSGIAWEEDIRPEYLNPTYNMYTSANMYRYIFSKEIYETKPFNYSSANAALLSEVIFKATGKSFATYADDVLFKPLEITQYAWGSYRNGNTNTSGGLYLTLDGLTRLGMLYLQHGVWKGKVVVDSAWITKSFKNYSDIKGYADVNAYGFMWWINDAYTLKSGRSVKIVSACGFNNNHLVLVPELDLILVTMGDYSAQPQKYLNLLADALSEVTDAPSCHEETIRKRVLTAK